jgi:Tfp pilus assembly protein PilF
MKAEILLRVLGLAALGLMVTTNPSKARADDADRAREARGAILELDLVKAHALLDDAVSSDPEVSLERSRLALYEGDYDRAAAILSKPELARSDAGAELLAVAEGCARATAAAVLEIDTARGVNIRFQDESDVPLAPFFADVAVAAREALQRDLKVELPRPLRIELVRDLFTLAAMTGLPESAAQTTGTVAVAKWGRVTMISPRAIPRGYPWADTLAHEMAHLAQTRASRERAPLWLQEGVAKRQETRWRPDRPLDDFPAADTLAAVGLDKGLGRPIDKLGGSIALLPTAEQAMVAFAEVSSFVRFWIKSTGDDALPELLVRLRTAEGEDYVDGAMKAVTGNSLSEWNGRWLHYLGAVRRELPGGARLGEGHPGGPGVQRGLRLGTLLLDRAHPDAAKQALEPAQKLAPFDPLLRHHLAQALLALGQKSEAEKLISRMEDVHSEFGPWMALHGRWLLEQGEAERAAAAFETGLQLCPLVPEVACEAKSSPDLPPSPTKALLCQAARSVLQD